MASRNQRYQAQAVSSSLLEIVQLPDGEIVLQRADDEGEPLIQIRFSEESTEYIGKAKLDIAKIMIQAGIQAVAQMDFPDEEGVDAEAAGMDEGSGESENRVLH